MIKAIIFDLGGVILDHKKEITIETLSEIFSANLGKIKQFFETLEDDWVTGKTTGKKVMAAFKKEFGTKKSIGSLLKEWEDIYENSTKINKPVLKIVDDLRGKGYKTYLLTDTIDFHHKLNKKKDIFDHFDRVFASFIEGNRKTNKSFFVDVLEEIGVKPNEAVLIDDRENNINLAISVGIHSILFKNDKDLLKNLKRILS